jgi:hypothetical protein
MAAVPQKKYDMLATMPRFAFLVEETMSEIEGFEGLVLAGPVTDRGVNLTVGDRLWVPTVEGVAEAVCSGFPLANWGSHRRDWVTVTVTGLGSLQNVTTGLPAHSDERG